MKHLALAGCIVLSLAVVGQKTERYYDYQWNPSIPENARFYSVMEKTDSGWFRNDYFLGSHSLQMRALFEDSACKIMNGSCIYFHANGSASTVGRMIHNKQEGICMIYYSNGMTADSALYHNGVPVGCRVKWHRNGYMSDSIYHVNDSLDVQVSWFDDGAIASAGYLVRGKMEGKWKFYHHNGINSAIEVYDHGKNISKEFFNEDGNLVADTSQANGDAVLKKGGPGAWSTYLRKNLYWPNGYQFSNGNMAVVVVQFTIDEQGKVENEEVVIPFHPEFDRIALKIIHNSPEWLPAMQHNRKVKFAFRQPVTFQQEE